MLRIRGVCALIRKVPRCQCLEDYTQEQRQAVWPPAKPVEFKHIRNGRLVENREKLLDYMPKNAVCAERGILYSECSEIILQKTQPAILHLIDIDMNYVNVANEKFTRERS
jgi:hypothetical protein